jgi:hypothetical protein
LILVTADGAAAGDGGDEEEEEEEDDDADEADRMMLRCSKDDRLSNERVGQGSTFPAICIAPKKNQSNTGRAIMRDLCTLQILLIFR